MAIKDIQRQGSQLGRIRLGQQVTRNGKTFPEKLSTFRFTTNSRAAAEQVAALYGGAARDWTGGTERFEVVTETAEIDVMVPPGERFIRQDYELWTAAGCVRRCDGETVTLRGGDAGEEVKACVCPSDGQARAAAAAKGNACKPTTRLNVMLPDLPDLGVWRVDSHGFYAAVELGGKGELLQQARDAGHILPARLRLDARERRTPGQAPRRFMVPVLEIGVTLRELATGAVPTVAQALPAAPARALTAGPASSAAAPLPPSGAAADPGGQTAQDFADLAAGLSDHVEVTALGKEALDAGLLADTVVVEGNHGPLGDYLTHRVRQLQAAAAAAPVEDVVDAEVVEDGPTVDDARAAASAWAGSR
jgi:hypothetical protein